MDLITSIRNGYSLDHIKHIIENGADIHATDIYGDTALSWASIMEHLEIVKYLAERGADINAINIRINSPLFNTVTTLRQASTHLQSRMASYRIPAFAVDLMHQ